MFKSVWLSVAIIPFLATPIFAQTATSEPDEIVSEGTIRGGDPAMGAFFSGDFETAEIEFKKNFRKLKRADMVLDNSAAATRGNAVFSDVRAGTPQVGAQGGAISGPGKTQINFSGLNLKERREGDGVLSGKDPGFQLYMIGLSQIQLKKYDEAKVSFKRALSLNKGLYDAHMRLGVLYLRDGQTKEARKQYKKLNKLNDRCKNTCSGKDDIALGLDVLGSALKQS